MVTRLKAGAPAFVVTMAVAMAMAPRVYAQALPPGVELLGERGSLDGTKLDGLVTLELGADRARVRRVTVDCHDGRADVVVIVGEERRAASVTLSAAEPERALALFVAELARGATAPEPPPPPATPAAPPPPAPPPSAPPPSAPASSSGWQLSVLGSIGARVMTTGGALLATPRVELGARRDGGLRLGATARYAYASADDPLGHVAAHAVSGGAAATYVLVSAGPFALATGPRLELGAVAAHGEGQNGQAATVLTVGGSWEIELHVKLGAPSLLLGLEAGTLLQGVQLRADDRDALHLSGPFLGIALGAML